MVDDTLGMTKQKQVFVKRGDGRWFDQAEVVPATTNGPTKTGLLIVTTVGGTRYTFKAGACVTKFGNPFYRVELV